MENNKEEAKKWFELFKVIVERESHTALSVNDLVNSITRTLNTLIDTCNGE